MILAAVDPGKTGAMVTLFEDGSTTVNRVPLIVGEKKGGKVGKTKADFPLWWSRWSLSLAFNGVDVAILEKVGARPEQGSVSMFNFGYVTGFAHAILCSSGVPVHHALPAVWKDKMGLTGQNKSKSVAMALDLVPSLEPELLSKAKGNTADVRHGIAEAGLLAYYGMMTIAG